VDAETIGTYRLFTITAIFDATEYLVALKHGSQTCGEVAISFLKLNAKV
jgi:hypothetical protein